QGSGAGTPAGIEGAIRQLHSSGARQCNREDRPSRRHRLCRGARIFPRRGGPEDRQQPMTIGIAASMRRASKPLVLKSPLTPAARRLTHDCPCDKLLIIMIITGTRGPRAVFLE